MELPVLSDSAPRADGWYAGGLRFTCAQCGNCCTGGPGYVWISHPEVEKLAAHLGLTVEQTIARFCRTVDGKLSLRERRTRQGLYDCVFLKDMKISRRDNEGNEIAQTIRACSVYAVRPLQCRTWPFWPENLSSRAAWDDAARRCHGMSARGGRVFSPEQIHAIRDAAEWPKNPPTSRSSSKSPEK